MAIVGSKTPVSIINEYFISLGVTPSYELIASQTGTQNPMFVYRLTAGQYFSEGQGSSKQQAKHNAAQSLINLLKQSAQEGADQLQSAIKTLSCPQDNLIAFNAVGSLTEYCSTKHYPDAVYDLIRDEGPPHARVFTIKCSVSQMSELGTARTKKQAKHQAAYAMLVTLKQLDKEEINPVVKFNVKETNVKSDHEKKDREAAEIYMKLSKSKRTVENSCFVSNQYRAYVGLLEKSDTLARLASNEYQKTLLETPYETLKSIAQDLGMTVEDLAVKTSSNDTSITFVCIPITPIMVRSGKDIDHASLRILEAILSML